MIDRSSASVAEGVGREELSRVRRASLGVLACFAFVCIYFVALYPGAMDANQESHAQLLRALGERGTADIEPELRILGKHGDVAVHGGRLYSNKAPGLSVAALPAYELLRRFLPAPTSLQDWLVFYGSRILSVTLAVFVALAVFIRRSLRSAPSHLLPLWIFALLFATPFAVYARSFFSHAFVAALLFLSFALASPEGGVLAAACSGFLAAAAVATEYPVAVIAACVLVGLALRGSRARIAAFLVGAVPPALALAWYHARYFGGILRVPPAASTDYSSEAARGLVGVSWPSLRAAAGLFLDPAHGLLYFSPFLILWPVVAVAALPRLRADPALIAPALGPLLLVAAISGYVSPHWRGGWCLGPRYLMAGMLLVFWLLAARARPRGPAALGLLVAGVTYGAVILALCGSTYWLIPYGSWNPARTIALYDLRRGLVEFNLGIAAGLPALASLLPPLLAASAGFVLAVRGSRIPLRPLAAGTLAGLLAATLLLAIPPSAQAVENSHREGLANYLLSTLHAGFR